LSIPRWDSRKFRVLLVSASIGSSHVWKLISSSRERLTQNIFSKRKSSRHSSHTSPGRLRSYRYQKSHTPVSRSCYKTAYRNDCADQNSVALTAISEWGLYLRVSFLFSVLSSCPSSSRSSGIVTPLVRALLGVWRGSKASSEIGLRRHPVVTK
jgi:hypothetical protein